MTERCQHYLEKGRPTILKGTGILLVMLVVLGTVFMFTDAGTAAMYKYKDENGVWHFTDTPDEDVYESAQQYIKDKQTKGGEAAQTSPALAGEDLVAHFQKNLPPANKIEQARNATVSIKMSLGGGTGFFVSQTGYIVTNRHVIDSSYGQTEDVADKIEEAKKQMEYQARLLDQAERDLRKQKAQLRRQKRSMRREEYKYWKNQLERREEALRQQRQQFEAQQRQFEEAYGKYEQDLISELSQSGYTIILADDTELRAEKVMISERYDLALLRLNGYKTPYIPPGDAHGLAHGQPLYAIGNSAGMGHTVTSGIFSGHRSNMLQTNAQINPGNSGGPLITKDGQVVGVNTSKLVHSSVEGVGFAIPIHVVLAEFGPYIGM
ncbi:MAG: trypsin-like peptidase domain-containing protein [Desulfobacterales bacterium]|jgi:S1-C subfamily serine protease